MFTFKLGSNIAIGNKILVSGKWKTVKTKFDDMVVLNDGTEVKFGQTIGGWKAK